MPIILSFFPDQALRDYAANERAASTNSMKLIPINATNFLTVPDRAPSIRVEIARDIPGSVRGFPGFKGAEGEL
jgi:hypothetical protein